MMSKFNEHLPILEGTAKASGAQLGVCAMGPVKPGDKLIWMRVWVWQQDDDHLAAAAGTSGEHLGGHDPSKKETLPFTDARDWMIQTQLEKHSDQFVEGKPALAMAMAIVEHESDSSRDVETWSQAVMVGPAHSH